MGALGERRGVPIIIFLLMVIVTRSSGQQCTAANNSQGVIVPNTDLPTQGVRLYFQEAAQPIPNFLMLRASQIEPTGFNSTSPTRALWCQSANTDSNNGTWFQPTGQPPGFSVVSSEDIDTPIDEPYQMVTCPGQVGLVRDIGLGDNIGDNIGLVQCVIRDEMNTTHTLTAGVYTGAIYDSYNGPAVDTSMQFALISSRDADPPVYTLTFNSSNGPPTVVECTRDGQVLDTSLYTVSREVLQAQFVQNGDIDSVNASEPDMPDVTKVTVTVMEREAGEMRCNVTVVSRNDSIPQQVVTFGTGSSTFTITVAGTPANVSANRSSATEVIVMWDAPSPAPDGYEVFCQEDGGDILSEGTTTNTELILTGVSVHELSCFVVAYGDVNTIPSARSSVAIAQAVVTITLDSLGSPVLAGTSRSLMCYVLQGLSVTFTWMKNGSLVTNASRVTVTTTSSSSTLTINPLRTSDGGQYQCIKTVVSNGTTITDEINLNVTISISSVTVTTIPNDTLYVDTFSDFMCNTTLSEYVDTPTTIMYQWLGPSLLTTGADYTVDGDTLRINRFNLTRDSDRMITCMATVLPSSGQQYVLQNNVSRSTQLNVLALSNAAFTPRLIIPGVPTAGNNFNIICRLDGVVERLAVIPSFILGFTVTQGGVSGDQSQDGLAFIRPRIFNPGMTDDVGTYSCLASISILDVFFGGSTSEALQIQILPPQLTVAITPSNIVTLYEGTIVGLTCTATIDTNVINTNVTVSSMWIAPNGEQLTNNSNDRITIVDMLQSAPYTSVLMFDPADDMDTGDYQCNVTVEQNSGQPLILMSSSNVTSNLNIAILPPPDVTVSTTGSTRAGQSFSLICTVTTAAVLTVRPSVMWVRIENDSMVPVVFNSMTTPTRTILTLPFSPLTFNHRGMYRCVIDLNIPSVTAFFITQDFNLTVEFPPPTVVVQPVNPSIPLVAGTARDLTCTISLTNVNDINVMVNFTWSIPMEILLSSSPRITNISGITQSGNQSSFSSTLSISPLDSVADSTAFNCLVSVNSDPADSFVTPTTANRITNIDVLPLPPPTVMTTSSGNMSLGSSLTLTCIVGVLEGLLFLPDIMWTKHVNGDSALNSTSVDAVRTNNTVTLFLNSLNTSDAGQYTCTATVNVSAINITVTNSSMVDIRLQIPSPTVSLTLSSADSTVSANSSTYQSYLAGSTLTITCVIVIPFTVDTPFDVEMEWTRDEFNISDTGSGNADPRTSITMATETSPNRYQTQLVFSTLSSSMDSGDYECSITIISSNLLLYVEDSTLVSENTTVNVQDPTISNFNATPTMVAVLESTCPDSDPHDNFTLICKARKPTVVIPQLMVQWLHNGSMRAGDVSVSDNGTNVVNTINVSNARVSDAGLYECVASIIIPDSPTVTTNTSSIVSITAMSVPNTPIVAVNAINPTNATIRITVPSIAYTRETYYILYNSQDGNTVYAQSNTVSGTADIIATNSTYFITLSDLEEDTTYNYTLTASNCIGNTTTATLSFRTLFNLPSLSVSVDSMDSSLIAGTNQSLLCFLDSTPLPVVFTTWLKNGSPVNTSDSRVITSTTLGNSTLTISSLRTSDGGQYQCIKTVIGNGTAINITDEIDLNVTISISSVTVTTIPNDTLYVDTFSDFMCNTTLSEYVDTPTTIMYQWLGPSLLTTGADYNITGDTLRINRFNASRDNGRTITCMATVLPSSGQQYVLQNNANISTQLTVEALSNATFTPRIIIPGVPTAGDNFNITCKLDGVVERLAVSPTVTLTFFNPPGGTPNNQSQNESAYILPHIFNPGMTAAGGTYECVATIISNLIFVESATEVLQIQIPPPQLTLTITPSNTTTLYEGTRVNLTCTATIDTTIVNTAVTVSSMWIAPNGEQLTSSSSNDRITIVESAPYTSVLMFDPADDMDTGDYQCNVTVEQNSSQPLILSSSSNATSNLNIAILPAPEVTVTTIGSIEAGQNFSLICTVTTAALLFVRPKVMWVKIENGTKAPVMFSNVTISTTTILTVSFFPVAFSHRGLYQCVVDLNISSVTEFSINRDSNLTVEFPPPTVVVQPVNPSIPLVAGTARDLTCTISLTNVNDINVMVNFTWSTPMGILLSSSPRITNIFGTTQSGNQSSFTSTLSISPLDSVVDTTVFACLVSVNSDPANSFVTSTTANSSVNITVLLLPPPTVMTTSSGTMSPGSFITLTCIVGVVEGLIIQPAIVWTKQAVSAGGDTALNSISVGAVRTNNTVTLSFNSINTSDAGQYTCTATVNVSAINITVTNNSMVDIRLEIPSPTVTLTLSSADSTVSANSSTSQSYLAGSTLTITCDVDIPLSINTMFNVTIEWTSDGNMISSDENSGRINITMTTEISLNHYQTQLVFSTLSSSMDSSIYECSVSIDSIDTLLYVEDPTLVSENTTVSVQDPSITNFTITPAMFTALESACQDTDSLDNFTLVCRAMKPAVVIPQLMLQWLHNGSMLVGGGSVSDSGAYVVNTLNVSKAKVNDAGVYQCIASIMIPNSPTVTTNTSSTVFITTMSVPNIPTAVLYAITPTNATIRITVPTIAYTRETYYILYTGQERDTDLAQSNTVSGTADITATNSTYFISLSDLEEDTTYNYTVTASNCIGNTTTATMSFMTLPPSISVSVDSMGSPLIAGTNRSLLCSLDSSTVQVTFTAWLKNGSPVNTSDSRVTVTMTKSNSTLNISSLRTSDGGQYQCMGTTVGNGTTINITDEIDLNVTISISSVTVTTIPNDTLYVDTFSDFMCNTTLSEYVDTSTTIMYQWLGPSLLTTGADYNITGDTLRINRFNASRDNGRTITCKTTVLPSLGQQYVLQNNANISTQLTVEALRNSSFTPRLIIPGVPTAGDNFSIICKLDGVVERLAVTPTVILAFSNPPGGTPGNQSQNGSAYIQVQHFSPGMTDDIGTYNCSALIVLSDHVFGNFTFEVLILQIPPPQLTLTITPSNTTTLYEGTPVNLTCTATIDTTIVNTAVTVSSMWIAPNGEQLTSSSSNDRITIVDMLQSAPYTSVLMFDPADDIDTGDYQCNVTVEQNTNQPLILPSINNATSNINIMALPPPTVMTTSSGTMSPGSSVTLTCLVGVVNELIVQSAIVWTKQSVGAGGDTALNSISVGAVRTNNTVTLSFNSINTSDAGQYTCTATVNVSAINITVTNNSMVDIRLQIPSPTVSLTLSSADSTVSANSSTSQSYLAGSTLTITCDVDIPLTVNTPFNVKTELAKNDDDMGSGMGSGSPRTIITMATETSPNRYQTQLVFSTLSSSMDSGDYECSITIISSNLLLYVEDSTLVSENTTVIVQTPPITNFTVTPALITVLESTCPDSDPHDNFTLICKARKPAVVIPQLMVQWLHNGSMRAGDVSVSDNGTNIVNTLTVSNARVSDAGLYECVASIVIPDSPTVTTNATSSIVFITTMSVPNIPTAVLYAINPTNATIRITVPTIAYTRETYYILYSGQQRDTDLARSDTVNGTANITATNSTYSISLSDLEEDTTYNYTVTASNCIGNTTTATMSFRTLPPAPSVTASLVNNSSPLIAGTNQSIVCFVEPSIATLEFITWMRNGSPVNTSDSRVTVSMTTRNSTLTISSLRTSDGGQYQCMGTVVSNGTTINITDEIDLNVTISISSVTVTTIPNDTLYVDTFSDFMCNTTLSEYVDTPTTIMYQWLGPSLLTTGADYNITGDTLRIRQFNTTRDNGRTITCMAIAVPSSAQQFVLQNTANISTQLTVEALSNAAFVPRLIIPGVPTAGDDFNIICQLDGVVERLAVTPTVILTFDMPLGGTPGNQSRNGSAYIVPHIFNPGMTDDAGTYRCNISTLVMNDNDDDEEDDDEFLGSIIEFLQIQIPPPQLTLTITPSITTTLYEGTPVNLTCTATIDTTIVNTNVTVSSMWIAPNGEQLTSSSSNDRITIVDMLQSAPYTSVLMFDPADDMDTGDYQCNITVVQNNNQTLILPSMSNVTGNLNITTLLAPVVTVTTIGSTKSGQNILLLCNVTTAAILSVRPDIMWVKIENGTDTEMPVVFKNLTTPTSTILSLPFPSLAFSHRGIYRCVVDLNISSVTEFIITRDINLTVEFPPPTVVVQPVNPSIPLVAGTARDLTCTINLTNVNDINVMVNFTWSTPMGILLSSSPRITNIFGTTQSGNQSSFTSTLSISPLNSVADSTVFNCLVSVNSDPADSFVTSTTTNNSVDITLLPLPHPTVMTTSSGTMSPGSSITLTCIVGVVEGLIVQPAIVWTKQAVGAGGDTALNSISVGAVRTSNTVTLSFNNLNTSDAGQYTCTATVNVSAINITVTNNSMVDIRLQIPSPTVSLTLFSADSTVSANSSTSQSYLAGSTLTITCDVDIPLTVDTPFNVEMEWTREGNNDFDNSGTGSGNGAVIITMATETSPNRYQTQLVFSILSSSMDSGNYECSITIDSVDSLLFVEDSALINESTTVNVQDPTISNFTVTPTMVAVLESTCPDSDPHDNFTLICKARKPAVVIPQLMVQWLHNGSMRAGDVSVSDNGTNIVNTLNVSNARVSDAGLYECVASIVIPDSPTVTTNATSSIVFITTMSVPNIPTAVLYAINPTNATIRITVPTIAYTRETYYILYSGQQRDTDLAQSDTVSGTADITATNSTYSITLSDLEEDTTYNYTVTASNCIGNTTTATMSFKTLFNLPSLSVSVDSMGSPLLAGTNRSLLCSLDSTSLPVIFTAWIKNSHSVNTSDSRIAVYASQSNSTLMISSLHTSDGGQYQCIRTVVGNGTAINITDVIDLNVTISISSVTVTTIPNDTLYVDTFSDFMCNTTLSEYVDTPTTIMYQWLGPSLLTTGADYNITGDTLRINRFNASRDNGRTITCMATVLPSSGQQYVLQNNANISTQLTVEALSNATFTPCIIIPGVPTAGDNFNITCKLDGVVERLAVSPTVTLTFFNPPGGTPNNQSQNESAYILPHIFNPGMTAAGGTYECVATIISNLIFVESATEVLQIQIPPPQLTLTITPSNTTTLYEGTPVNLTCTATIDTTIVNTAVTVSSMWIAPNGEQLTSSSSNDRITIVDMLQSAPYTSVLMFDPADDMDTGDYQCNITVEQNSGQPLILSSMNDVTSSLYITVLPPPEVIVTTIGSTEARQNFSLLCNVTLVTMLSVPPNVVWARINNGAMLPNDVVTFNNMTTPTSTLSTLLFPSLSFSDEGVYRCIVDLNISSVTEIRTTQDYNLTVVFVCDPENTTTEQFGSYNWPEAEVGDTVTLPCVFRPSYNASRTCTERGSWVAVDIIDCRIIDQPIRNFTLYIRFSSLLSSILAGQNIQGALRNIENVVLQQVNVTTMECRIVARQAVDIERDRVECTIVGPTDSQDQSPFPVSFLNQTIAVLRASNFTIPGTEISSVLGYCSYETTEEGTRGTFHWNETEVNTTASTSCFYGPNEVMATRQCVSRLTSWAAPSIDQCRTIVSTQFSNIQQVNVSVDNVNLVINNVTNIVSSANETSDQNSDNLRVVADVLTQSVDVIQTQNVSVEVASQVAKDAVGILDNVEEWPMTVVQNQSNTIVQAFDRIVDALIESVNFTDISVVQTDLALRGDRISKQEFSGRTLLVGLSDSQKLQLSVTNDSSDDISQNLNAVLSLPQAILTNIQNRRNELSIAFTVYNSPTLFPVRNTPQDMTVASTVVGSQVVSVQVGGIADGTRLTNPVTFQLRLTNLNTTEVIAHRRCVFWDFKAANGNGDWNISGCTLTTFDESTNVVSCECDHLTNFACLVDISIRVQGVNATVLPRELILALDITTYIGVFLSLVGLILLLLTYLAFKEFRQKDVTKFHVQLAVSMLLMLIVFMAGIGRTENRAGCITVSVLLHYLILVVWMWMGAEAALLFQKLVIVFKKPTTLYIAIVSIVCWASPLLPVVISVSINPDYYITQPSNTTRGFCFISEPGVFFGAFLVPIILIIVFNACIFISSSYVVIRLKVKHQKDNLARKSNQKLPLSSKDVTCKLLALLAGFMFLLGLSWIILLFTVVGADTSIYAAFAIQWLFVFFNSLQGFFLFVFFVALNRDARKLWAIRLCPWFKNTKNKYSTRYKHSSTSGNTASTKLSSQKFYLKPPIKTHDYNEELSVFNGTDYPADLYSNPETNLEEETLMNIYTPSKQPQIRMKRTSTIRKTHDIETAEVMFSETTSEDDEKSTIVNNAYVNDDDIDDAPDLHDQSGKNSEDSTTMNSPSRKQAIIRIKRSSTIRKTHDIETAEVVFDKSGSEDEETSL